MASIINTNIQSLNAQRNLSATQNSLATSMQRLSSGLRINSAKDDAAGLAISDRMTTQIRGINQAARNANDGVSLAQTAEGALSSIGNNLQRIRELAVQSRNATNSDDDRISLQKEVSQLTAEIDRVASQTAFNGTKLLDGSFTSKEFQVGANQGQVIAIDSIVNASTSKLGTWDSVAKASTLKLSSPETVPPQTAAAAVAGTAVTTATITFAVGAADLNSGNVGAAVKYGFNDFKVNIGGQQLDIKGDGLNHTDAAAANTAMGAKVVAAFNALSAADKPAGVTAANAAGVVTFTSAATNTSPLGITLSDATNERKALAGATAVDTAPPASKDAVVAGNYFSALKPGDLKINGVSIVVEGGATTVSAQQSALLKAINAKSSQSNVSASIVDGSIVLKGAYGDVKIEGVAAKLTENGLTANASSATTAGAFVASEKGKQGFSKIDVSSVEGADNAILAMDAALKAVSSGRAELGAMQNRFASTVDNLQTNSENLSASRSRILDADFAEETANLSRSQILQQAGTAMVAQANQLPQGVLALLR